MGLGNERTLLTGIKGRCWEATFPAADGDVGNVQYRYCIINAKGNNAVFEREPNRQIAVIPGRLTCNAVSKASLSSFRKAKGAEKAYRQREWRTYDGNFVPPDLSYQDIPPNLAIGPYPQCEEDVILMKERGITGVINVQTDDDHRFRMINWELMEGFYKEHGISVKRIPIMDFNGDELARLVKVAAEGVHSLVQEAEAKNQAPRVYIHCTAGMGRAPAVACVYLVLHKGFKLNDALDHCKRHRNVCAPNWSAMENALRSG